MLDNAPLFNVPRHLHTRWASAENWDAAPGSGGRENHGRKGSPCRALAAGESFTMAHADQSGCIRRIWVTIDNRALELLRGLVLRVYWDGDEKPAVEAPLGDFFCLSLGRNIAFRNAWFDNPEGRSFNCRIPMPFRTGFKMTVTNESPKDLGAFFYDVDFTVGDEHPEEMCYFHAHFRRENPTTLRKDFEILPRIEGRGRFLGANLGVISDTKRYGTSWWGEGEVKVFLDGDSEYPTLAGTGTEDYIATGWGQGQYSHAWHGCPIADHERMQYSFYRIHGPDPVFFHTDVRVTIQQIGCCLNMMTDYFAGKEDFEPIVSTGDGEKKYMREDFQRGTDIAALFEREDDWSSVAYFYLDSPSSTLPDIQPYEERVADLTGDPPQA